MTKVYSKRDCVQCDYTKREMTKLGIDFVELKVDEDLQALEDVKLLGYLAAPVVVTDNDHWSGFRPDKIKALAA